MSRLVDAAERLKAAIAELEIAASRRPDGTGAEDSELRAALERAREKNATLSAAADKVSGRLDQAIKRIETMLEA